MTAPIFQPGTQEHQHALKSFGLAPDILQDIGVRIYGGHSQATPNDALNAAGTYAYLAAVRALRDILCPLGWRLHREQNLEMIFAPSSQFAIIPSSGDKNTGLDKVEPKTKNSKGNQTEKLVIQNQNQVWLFPEMEPNQLVYDPESIPTWFLLYHIDLDKNEIRMELSLPINIDISDLKVDQWKERIILSTITVDPTPIDKVNQQEIYSDFDIEIKRKTNE